MAWKRQLWSTDLALVTFLRWDDLIIFYIMTCSPHMPTRFGLFISFPCIALKRYMWSTDLSLATL